MSDDKKAEWDRMEDILFPKDDKSKPASDDPEQTSGDS